MRAFSMTLLLAFGFFGTSALAAVPDPMRSTFGVSGNSAAGCLFVFGADAGLDVMTVAVTLRDAFDNPVANCSTSVTLEFVDVGDSNLDGMCSCVEPLQKSVLSDAGGYATFQWSRLGGHGSFDVAVTLHCAGNIAVGVENHGFTSPDLDGSCDAAPASSVGIIDLGMWAIGLTLDWPYSDYDCDGVSSTVVDLGVWASGLDAGC